jgi:hypothetical protein|tara:strand:+ start:3577 stop:5802 length:2226 start_codon:yes stop_codon:yes gene_type:complete
MSQHTNATAEERFKKLFDYSEKHYDASYSHWSKEKNKAVYKYDSEPKKTSNQDWLQHLHGEKHLTVVPWKSKDEFNSIFGAIDIDDRSKDKLEKIAEKSKKYNFVPHWTVSNGLHLYTFFSEPVDVTKVRSHLEWSLKQLELDPKTEIFPKQKKPTDKGNGIKIPCCGVVTKNNAKIGKLYNFLSDAEANIISPDKLKICETVKQKKPVDQKSNRTQINEYLNEITYTIETDNGSTDLEILRLIGFMVGKRFSDEEIFFEVTKVTKEPHGTYRENYKDDFEGYLQEKIDRTRESMKIDEGNNRKGQELLDRIVYLAQNDKWFDKKKNQIYTDKSINIQFGHIFKKQTPTQFLKSRDDKTVVEDFCYEPKLYKPGDAIIEKNGLFYINKYQPHTLAPIQGDVSLYEELLDHLFDSLEAKTVFEDWVSYNYQYPGEKIKWALLITTSSFQVGKGSLFRGVQETLGYENTRKIDVREALDKSKLFLTDRQIVLLDEMKSDGNFAEKESLLNSLKTIITDEDHSSRALFVDYKAIKTCTNIMLFSNFHDALSLTEKEERYWVHHTNCPRLNEKFYDHFHKWLDGNGKNYLLYHFKTREISESFNPKGVAPKTKHLKTMARSGGHPLVNQIRDRFEEQLEPFESDRELMSSMWLYEWCKRKNILGRSRLNEISKALETIKAINVGQCPVKRATPNGPRIHKPTIWIIRNKDKWKNETLENIGDEWASDPLNAGIDIFGGVDGKSII